MKRVIALVLLWLVCGLYTWGTGMATEDWEDRIAYPSLRLHSRDEAGFIAVECLGGPFGAVATAIYSNFNQHGWELWEK